MNTRAPQERAKPVSVSAAAEDPDRLYTIGELAEEFDVTTRTIRFYEAKGLIMPARRGVARCYGRRDRARLKLILRGKNLGFSLEVIAQYLLKGTRVAVVGRLQHRTYTRQDGTPGCSLDVIASEIDFAGGTRRDPESDTMPMHTAVLHPVESLADEEVPF